MTSLKMLGGGNRKPALVNSWNWPSIPNRFLSRLGHSPIPALSSSTSSLRLSLDAATYSGSGDWIDSVSQRPFVMQNGPTHSPSLGGGSFNFNADDNQYASCPTSLPNLNQWSVLVWHYYTGNNTGSNPCLITETYPGMTSNINYTLGKSTSIEQSNNLTTAYFSPYEWRLIPTTFSLTPDTWNQIVGTFDGTTLKMYINNTFVQSQVAPGRSVSSQGGIYLMARWDAPGFGDYWDGKLAIVQIYDTPLSTTDIAADWIKNQSRFFPP